MNFPSVLTDESSSDSLSPANSFTSEESSVTYSTGSDNLVEAFSSMQRKTTHKISEKIRRKAINKKYEDLRVLLPDSSFKKKDDRSKLTTKHLILQQTVNYIDKLKTDCSSTDKLCQELTTEKQKHDHLTKELQIWQKKIFDIRQTTIGQSSQQQQQPGEAVAMASHNHIHSHSHYQPANPHHSLQHHHHNS